MPAERQPRGGSQPCRRRGFVADSYPRSPNGDLQFGERSFWARPLEPESMPGIAAPLSPADPAANGEGLPPLAQFLAELGRLLAAAPGPDTFYAEFLRRVLAALQAEAGAVWGLGPQGDL